MRRRINGNNRLRAWLIERGIRPVDVARAIGRSKPLVSHFFSGYRLSRTVRDYLLSIGCPLEVIEWKDDRSS